ncbi:hypothetical protein ACFSUJ_23300 [Streptomyces lusitanus]|uniref:Uncharacterized protein n=1 Tax=Streptomyces lusitanus TaxID=68232 RepID=A0ABU3JRU2_9ACTN|nr:hypothetical protein [Streptomyces lusitanus]
MAQPVLALGCALVTAAGCVWYLPALADLRAGAADRPPSRRTAALACLTGWGTVAALAPALLVAPHWWVPCAVAAAGGTAAAVLRVRAAVRRGRERRETARLWAGPASGGPPPSGAVPRGAVAALAVTLPLAVTAALLAPAVGRG